MGTAERRLEIMKQLCRERHVTMPTLAKQYNVSVRTIQRDILELTFMMPIYVNLWPDPEFSEHMYNPFPTEK